MRLAAEIFGYVCAAPIVLIVLYLSVAVIVAQAKNFLQRMMRA